MSDQTEAERQARHTWDLSEVIARRCIYCARLSRTSEYASCEAFQGRIPEAILLIRSFTQRG